MEDIKEEYTKPEYLEKQSAARQWIEELLQESIDGDDLSESLKDGIILCRLISVLCPSLELTVITSTPHKFRLMENISAFLEACTRLGFAYTELFAPPDLFEKKNLVRVYNTLKKIADYAALYDFPKWKGAAESFSNTERKSIIGGDASKALPPKGSVPPKKVNLPIKGTPLPLLPIAPGGIPTRPAKASSTSSSTYTSSAASAQPRKTSDPPAVVFEGERKIDAKAEPSKFREQKPTWDGLFASSLSSSQQQQGRDEHYRNEVSLPTPQAKFPPTPKPPPAASAKLSTFQKVQQSLFLPEDVEKSKAEETAEEKAFREEKERRERDRAQDRERAEQERWDREKARRDREREAQEKEKERQEKERRDREEKERREREALQREREEKERRDREEKARWEKEEQARREREREWEEQERRVREEKDRLDREEREWREKERIEQEKRDREANERREREKERLMKERERLEQEWKEKEERERRDRERADKERKEREEKERLESEKWERERERMQQEKDKLEKDFKSKADRERREREERERKDREERERKERERADKERRDKEENDRRERERVRMQSERERLEKELRDKEEKEREREEKEKRAREERDRAEREQIARERERLEKERLRLEKEREKLERDRREEQERREEKARREEREKREAIERLERDSEAKERRDDRERREREKAEKVRWEKERAEMERREREREEKERRIEQDRRDERDRQQERERRDREKRTMEELQRASQPGAARGLSSDSDQGVARRSKGGDPLRSSSDARSESRPDSRYSERESREPRESREVRDVRSSGSDSRSGSRNEARFELRAEQREARSDSRQSRREGDGRKEKGGQPISADDIEAALRQIAVSKDAVERESLQQKIGLLVSEVRLAEYLHALPRGPDSDSPFLPAVPKKPLPPVSSGVRSNLTTSADTISSATTTPSTSDVEPKHHRSRNDPNRRSLSSLPSVPKDAPASPYRVPPPVPSPPTSLSDERDNSPSVSRKNKHKRNSMNTSQFPPPLPPILSNIKRPAHHEIVESSTDYSSSSSSATNRRRGTEVSPPGRSEGLRSGSSNSHQPRYKDPPPSYESHQQAREPERRTRGVSTPEPVKDRDRERERPSTQSPAIRTSKPLSPDRRSSKSYEIPLNESVEKQIQQLEDVLKACHDGSTMLHVAARHNNPQVVAFLLQCGEDPNPQDHYGKTPLHVAAALGNRDVVDVLISGGAKINTLDSNGATALQRAAEHNQSVIMNKIVRVPGVKIDTLRKQDGWTPLYTSSHQGNSENVNILLSYHADPNVQNSEGWTPLHAASHQGHYKVVKMLTTAGANLNVLSNQGTTPLFHAVEKGELDIAQFLGELGANIDLSKQFCWKPIHIAVYKGEYESVAWLVSKGARLNEIVRDTNLKGYTPLHILVSSDWLSDASKKNLELLLSSGASLLTRDETGATPLHLAAYWDNVDAVKIIMKYVREDDIVFDMRDNNGETAVDIAAYYGNLQVLKLLPRNNTTQLKNNPQTTGKMLPPNAPPAPPAPLPYGSR